MKPWYLLLLLAVVVVEGVLTAVWNRLYFRIGLPLFLSERPVPRALNPTPRAAAFEARESRSFLWPLVFREVDPSTILVRERAFDFDVRLRYLPVMHGRITFDAQGSVVRVVGLANWSPFALIAVFATLVQESSTLAIRLIAGAPIALALVGYCIQLVRFRRIARLAADRWTEP